MCVLAESLKFRLPPATEKAAGGLVKWGQSPTTCKAAHDGWGPKTAQVLVPVCCLLTDCLALFVQEELYESRLKQAACDQALGRSPIKALKVCRGPFLQECRHPCLGRKHFIQIAKPHNHHQQVAHVPHA